MDLKAIIDEAIRADYIMCYPIEDFTIEDLINLSDMAKKNNVELSIRKETSNFYYGTLLEVQKEKSDK